VDPLVGTTVAHYDVEARLGGGGMGIVYAARDTKLGRRVALKFLPPQWSHDESAKQRFIREAQAASATDHPNICTIHDIGSAADGQLFIVMAHYDGETLKTRLERGRLPVDEAVDIAAQVAEGLAKAHGQGVVHRDIKPGNLMLTEHGVKILDFGLAKFADARWKLTLEGSTIGTVAYMSPEQARGEDADARSDVWAVGVVLYEMLTGGVPFKGGSPEAISHAIKNDTPAPIRATVPEVSDALEQLVFRALLKDPAVRLPSARDLARALRLIQGRTLPIDLRTEPLPPVNPTHAAASSRPVGRRSRKAIGVAAAAAAILVGMPLWVFSPVDRVPIAIAPVVNQTGYAELDDYRMALTSEVVGQLADARTIRPLSYDRLLQIVRQFSRAGSDVSSRDAMQALTDHSGARVIVVPTLLNEDGGWKARVEFRNPATAAADASFETQVVVSSLAKDAAYRVTSELAAGIQDYFISTAPRRAYVADALRRLWSPPSAVAPRFRALDAAAAFARGLDAYDQQEYAAALQAFTAAAEQDPRSPLVLAWRSRVARLMRRDQEAEEAAENAARAITTQTRAFDRLTVEAIVAEARGDAATAEARYDTLIADSRNDPSIMVQRASFLERQGRAPEAIATYHAALGVDARLIRPHVDLCRLYNPRELANARQHGELALQGYRTLGDRGGEAQSLFCLVDILRLGSVEERAQARRHAERALGILEGLAYSYNVSRAHNYVALAAYAQGDLAGAADAWERSLAVAQETGNAVLQPLVLMNLGSVHHRLGQQRRQLEYLERSATLFERQGQQQRAAELEASIGALLIEYGGKPEEGLRRLQNALTVSEKLGNTTFELFGAQVRAGYDRFAGRLETAERELNRALALAKERDRPEYVRSITLQLGHARFDASDYIAARDLLATMLADDSAPIPTSARILLVQSYTRLGDFDAARRELEQAERELQTGADPQFRPLLDAASGELALAMGQDAVARAAFARAAAYWTDDFPEAASVEARANLGLLDALDGRASEGRAHVQASLEQARRMGRLSVEARCRLQLARIDIGSRNYRQALETLAAIPPDDESRRLGAELRAQVLYWRSRALAALGDPAAAADAEQARRLVTDLAARVPNDARARYLGRPDIRVVAGGVVS
jgi:tetratricopeptide (TPR) repeat protein